MTRENDGATCFFDGCCEPVNPGGTAAYGWVAYYGKERQQGHGVVGRGDGMTNNVGEYAGLLSLMSWLDERKIDKAKIYGDSSMVVEMAAGRWGKKNPHKKAPHLIPWLMKCREIIGRHPDWSLSWIPREENTEADTLSKIHK